MTTAQSPSPAPVGQGLTDEKIFETALSHGYGFFNAGESRAFNKYDTYGKKMLAFIRAIESEVLSKAQDGLVMRPFGAPASQQESTLSGWISVEDRLPPAGEMVLVYAPSGPHDYPDTIRISFDCIDPEDDDAASWAFHNENYEHYRCVAGPDMVGPSERAPYTHWMPSPPVPGEQSSTSGAAASGDTSAKPINFLATSGHDATGAAKQLVEALKTVSEFPITDPDKNMDALNMKLIAADALVGFSAAAAPSEADKLDAARDVLAERQRQTQVEGWTPEHDDQYDDDELAMAAISYAKVSGPGGASPNEWPWPESRWKPRDNRRNLVKAAALLIAEIERIDRAAIAAEPAQPAEGL